MIDPSKDPSYIDVICPDCKIVRKVYRPSTKTKSFTGRCRYCAVKNFRRIGANKDHPWRNIF